MSTDNGTLPGDWHAYPRAETLPPNLLTALREIDEEGESDDATAVAELQKRGLVGLYDQAAGCPDVIGVPGWEPTPAGADALAEALRWEDDSECGPDTDPTTEGP